MNSWLDRKKPWSGRFQKATAKNVEKFTSSLHYDQRLYLYDIEGSIAHATMLADQGIISRTEARRNCIGAQRYFKGHRKR